MFPCYRYSIPKVVPSILLDMLPMLFSVRLGHVNGTPKEFTFELDCVTLVGYFKFIARRFQFFSQFSILLMLPVHG
jgi:hypothetical protein